MASASNGNALTDAAVTDILKRYLGVASDFGTLATGNCSILLTATTPAEDGSTSTVSNAEGGTDETFAVTVTNNTATNDDAVSIVIPSAVTNIAGFYIANPDGDKVFSGVFGSAITVSPGDTVQFAVGDIDITLDGTRT